MSTTRVGASTAEIGFKPAPSLSAPTGERALFRRCRAATEAILLAMVCISPWAFGAVEAWAELGLYLGVAAVAILNLITGLGVDRTGHLGRLPGLALAALALLALGQATPLPAPLLRLIDPAAAASRSDLLSERALAIAGDSGPAVAAPSATITRDPEATRNEAARLLAAWIVFQAVLGLGTGPAPLRRFGIALAANGTLLALFTVIQLLSWNGKVYWTVQAIATGHGGPFICHNHLAAYLNLGLGFALCGLLAPKKGQGRGARLWPAYAASLIVVGVLASLSRSGFLGMVTALGLTILVLRPTVKRLAGGLAAVVVMACVFQYAVGTSAPYQRLSTLAGGKPFAQRLEIWRDVARAWRSSPVFGAGLGSFPTATAAFITRDRGEFFAHSENEYLEVLVEGGLAGFGLVVVGLLATAWSISRALRAAAGPSDRVLILGALFGVTALATQCLGDFPMHIPAVAVTVVVLVGHLVRLGGETPAVVDAAVRGSRTRIAASALAALAIALVAVGLLPQAIRRARAEAELAGSGVPAAGTAMPSAGLLDASHARLLAMRGALERAVRQRPDWAEGYLRLGQVHESLYARIAGEWLAAGAAGDPKALDRLSDPLWLHGLVHAPSAEDRPALGDVLDQDPVKLHLVPAARSFLEARRRCPRLAMSHAELAGLDYLLRGGPATATHVERALRLAGSDSGTIARLARAAAQAGDLDLAARCWRKQLRVRETGWTEVADIAGALLSPARILEEIVPTGRLTLSFAERLYTTPERKPALDTFLKAALQRLPRDPDLADAERLYLEGRALALLGDRKQASDRFETALGLEPYRADWRADYVAWLVVCGRFREAHDQALVGMHLEPASGAAQRTLDLASEALARGSSVLPGESSP